MTPTEPEATVHTKSQNRFWSRKLSRSVAICAFGIVLYQGFALGMTMINYMSISQARQEQAQFMDRLANAVPGYTDRGLERAVQGMRESGITDYDPSVGSRCLLILVFGILALICRAHASGPSPDANTAEASSGEQSEVGALGGAPEKTQKRSSLVRIGVVCLVAGCVLFYYFTNVYDAMATGEGVIMSGNRIGGPGFEDHQRRLAIYENGKLVSVLGICAGMVLCLVGIVRKGQSEGPEHAEQ